jgi:DNA-binding IclR family transcriptional regulator
VASTVSRVTQVIEGLAVSEAGGATASDLAAQLSMSRQALVRVLDELVALGIVTKENDSRRYFLTLKWYQWVTQAASRFLPSPAIRQEMALLAAETRLPAFYAVMEDTSVVLLERAEYTGNLVVSAPYPARNHWVGTSSGLAIAAFSHQSRIQQLIDLEVKSKRESEKTVSELQSALKQVHAQGYAEHTVDNRRYSLCAPILDHSGYAVAGLAVGVSSFPLLSKTADVNKDEVIDALREAAARCSAHLGHGIMMPVP